MEKLCNDPGFQQWQQKFEMMPDNADYPSLLVFLVNETFSMPNKKKKIFIDCFLGEIFSNLALFLFIQVGFFGYVAFHNIDIPGDVISVFPNTFFADVMKICFVFSIVITFPVIIFPCRSSIYTLLFAKVSLHVYFLIFISVKLIYDACMGLPHMVFPLSHTLFF